MPNGVWWKNCVKDSFIRVGYDYDEETFEKVYTDMSKISIVLNIDNVNSFESPAHGFEWDFGVFFRLEGVEKPNPRIYEIALERAGNIAPKEVLHIGDSMRKDYVLTISVGMHALLLDRFNMPDAEEWRKSSAILFPDLMAAKDWLTSEKSSC
ncbi:hypothetical protein CJ030_MR1G013810 [Morella rubra]|uniref:Haloacid dehalogenase-like hydrolase domain-containing protein 3 n=1 Tax=Morella rubra TaxID=262757 RepID=A0A6A1WZH1_9ROSI|nr:hypothetical protein CJ030_MR1G013810 [Morella rubra]